MGLLSSLRNEQTQHLCQLMKILEYAPDYIMLIHHLLRGAFMLLLRATNIKVWVRCQRPETSFLFYQHQSVGALSKT
jgi:hypothetical protein